jgi:hypothetical protein
LRRAEIGRALLELHGFGEPLQVTDVGNGAGRHALLHDLAQLCQLPLHLQTTAVAERGQGQLRVQKLQPLQLSRHVPVLYPERQILHHRIRPHSRVAYQHRVPVAISAPATLPLATATTAEGVGWAG